MPAIPRTLAVVAISSPMAATSSPFSMTMTPTSPGFALSIISTECLAASADVAFHRPWRFDLSPGSFNSHDGTARSAAGNFFETRLAKGGSNPSPGKDIRHRILSRFDRVSFDTLCAEFPGESHRGFQQFHAHARATERFRDEEACH